MSNKHHLLIIDDDNRICKLLKQFFFREGFFVSTASSTKEAVKLLENFVIDLIILDVMLPQTTGIEFARYLKNEEGNIPIILLTALGENEDRISGLEAGADDYLVKPIEPRELLLRTKKLIELYGPTISNKIYFGNNVYDRATKEFFKNNVQIHLTAGEASLLEVFLDNYSEVISRDDLANLMGNVSGRAIDVRVLRLREKIEGKGSYVRHLQTIRNKGYVFYI